MKITIKNIIKENKDIDPKQRYINGILNMIKPPYFNFLKVNEVPEKLWNEILSKLFNQKVKYENRYPYPFRIFDSNNNEIYIEESYEDDNDEIEHIELGLPVEASWYGSWYGFWSKREYDENNNRIYQLDSTGFWIKREYDSRRNVIYYEDSNGVIRDNRSSNPINENKDIDSEQRYVNGIVNIIKPPYYNFLKVNEVPEKLWNDIFSKLFKQKVKYSYMFDRIFFIHDSNNKEIYREEFDGFVADEDIDLGLDEFGYQILGLDEFGNPIIDVYWEKHEYDSNNNLIYYEKSGGYWEKREYDSNNNQIYYEDSDGVIRDKRPSNPINEDIDPKQKFLSLVVDNMVKQSKDNFFPFDSEKMSFTEYCKIVYGLTDDEIDYVFRKYRYLMGWDKWDTSLPYLKKLIYSENSNGIIRDNRSSNPINEDIDPKQRYINGILNMIRRPYMGFLMNNEVPEELWEDILSKIFNTNDISWEMNPDIDFDPDIQVRYELIIQDEKGRQLYYEVPDYWEQLIYGYSDRLDMDFNWFISSGGVKRVNFTGKNKLLTYSNQPHYLPWSDLSDDIKNNKFFDLNY